MTLSQAFMEPPLLERIAATATATIITTTTNTMVKTRVMLLIVVASSLLCRVSKLESCCMQRKYTSAQRPAPITNVTRKGQSLGREGLTNLQEMRQCDRRDYELEGRCEVHIIYEEAGGIGQGVRREGGVEQ